MRLCHCLIFASLSLSLSAAPFVTPRMMKRNGLTDAQFEQLWKIGKNPKVDQAAARDWVYRSARFQNVTNWLDLCGQSNDFARLSFKLQGDNFALEETNKAVVAENVSLSNTNAVLVVAAEKTWKVEKSAAKAKKHDQHNFEKWVKDTDKARSKSSADMADFYNAVLELAQAVGEDG